MKSLQGLFATECSEVVGFGLLLCVMVVCCGTPYFGCDVCWEFLVGFFVGLCQGFGGVVVGVLFLLDLLSMQGLVCIGWWVA